MDTSPSQRSETRVTRSRGANKGEQNQDTVRTRAQTSSPTTEAQKRRGQTTKSGSSSNRRGTLPARSTHVAVEVMTERHSTKGKDVAVTNEDSHTTELLENEKTGPQGRILQRNLHGDGAPTNVAEAPKNLPEQVPEIPAGLIPHTVPDGHKLVHIVRHCRAWHK